MSTTKTTSVLIKTDDLKGSGSTDFNAATNQRIGNIKFTWSGGTLTFASVSEYQSFLSQVIIPLTNSLNSPSGVSAGYVSATVGVAGTDKVSD